MIKQWLMEKTTWAGLALLVTAIGTWVTTGDLSAAKEQFLSAGMLLLLKGRKLLPDQPPSTKL